MMVEEAFFSSGVSLSKLEEWLGQPLDSTYDGDETISVSITHVVGGVSHEVSPSSNEIVSWDCLGYEKTFRAIHEAASHASESRGEMVLQALSASSQVHLLSQCRAERVGNNVWIMQHLCMKHMIDLSSSTEG
jgi:hypothetical protein